MASSDIMTLSEVASYLRVAEKTVHRMLGRSEIPSVKVAGQWRFLKPVIDEWLILGMKNEPDDGIVRLLEKDDAIIPVSRFLSEDLILTDLKASDRDSVLEEIARHLEKAGVTGSWEKTCSLLKQRENMMTTAVAPGIAFPHPRNPEENESGRPSVFIGISPGGVDFSSIDGSPTRLFIMVYTNSEVAHLKLLAKINRMAMNPEFVDSVCSCRNPGEVINIFMKEELKEN